MSDSRKRRWYQFSLRMLLAIVTVSALGMAWWKHRSDCLDLAQFHAERNTALVREVLRINLTSDMADTWSSGHMYYHKDTNYSYCVILRESLSGSDMAVLTVESGILPDKHKKLQAEMAREAELVDEYYHAIWRPWERFWIDEAP